MKNNNIQFILLEILPNGGNRIICDLSNYLNDKGFNIEIVCSRNLSLTPFKYNKNIKIKAFPNLKNKYISHIIFIIFSFFLINSKKFVFATFFLTYYLVIFKNLFFKINFVYFVQGIENLREGFLSQILNYLCIHSYNSKRIVTSNKTILQSIENMGGKPIENINIGITDIFFDYPAINTQKRYDIIYFARVDKFKRLDRFVELIKHPEMKNIKYCVVSQDINLLKKLKSNFNFLITALPKNDRELINLIDQSKLIYYTSEYDGLGLPPLECMSRKVPFVSFPFPGLLYYTNNKLENLIINSIESAKNKILFLLDNKEKYNFYAKLSYIISKNYHNKKSYKKMISIIKNRSL